MYTHAVPHVLCAFAAAHSSPNHLIRPALPCNRQHAEYGGAGLLASDPWFNLVLLCSLLRKPSQVYGATSPIHKE
jgi:hypothetical protein